MGLLLERERSLLIARPLELPSQVRTYASVAQNLSELKLSKNLKQINEQQLVILIKPRDAEAFNDIEGIKAAVMKSFNPKAAKVHVTT